ncbi:lasso peptide biosynthesis B2 protein [Parasphingorhabdus sp. DH2-15]|uniref:lasso peptide biosynthesis B2 protein n=1 Tax=Parasphingorhabdus sp. DH2-15 TaxID=3444112 RepID=UPI003F68682A
MITHIDNKDKLLCIRNDCHIVYTEQEAVILDINTENYIHIDKKNTQYLKLVFGKSPAYIEDKFPELDLRELLGLGCFHFSHQRKPHAMPIAGSAKLEIPGPLIDKAPSLSVRSVFLVGRAISHAGYLLKYKGLKKAIGVLNQIREKRCLIARDQNELSDLVEIYKISRPFFYDAHDRCTLNSLSLILYLSYWGVMPRWCFGVTLYPFSAHCWVEDSDWLYNDQFARTCRFSQILRV